MATLQQEIQQRTESIQHQSAAQQSAVAAQAKTQLIGAKQVLQSAQAELNLQTSQVSTSINGDNGLLAQLAALGKATAGNSTLELAQLLLFGLFVIIDLMPVTVRVILNLSPENIYDQILEAEEETQLQAADFRRKVRLSVAEAEAAAWERARQGKLRRWEAERLHEETN